MMTTTMEHQKAHESVSILKKAVCVSVDCHYFGNNRKVDVDLLIERNGGHIEDDDQFTATKKLIDPKVIAPAMRVFGRMKRYLRKRSLPMHRIFGERTFLIPNKNVEDVDSTLLAFQRELDQEAAKVAATYEAAKKAAKEKLGPFYIESEYMPAWKVAMAFGIDWRYVGFSSPENLDTISSALARASHEKYDRLIAEAADEARAELRRMALLVASKLVDKLGYDKTGKPKAVRETCLNDLIDFLDQFDRMNLTGDDQLAQVVTELRAATEGTTVEAIREFDQARERLIERASDAINQLHVLTGIRSIRLDDE